MHHPIVLGHQDLSNVAPEIGVQWSDWLKQAGAIHRLAHVRIR